jgi:hypothetical protein
MKTFSYLWQYLTDVFLKWEIFQIKSKHAFYIQRRFFRKSCRLWDNVEKYGGAREDAENVSPARCILDK